MQQVPNGQAAGPEVPNAIPAGSKFWAEVEPATGEKFKGSFDFKQQ